MVSRRELLVGGLGGVLGGLVPRGGGSAPSGPRIRGGCIRFYAGGPEWHTNGTHKPVGINMGSLRIKGSDLSFTLDGSAPVMTAFATPDETLVARGVDAGISGGVHECVVRFSHKGQRLYLDRPADYKRLVGANANLWVTVVSAG